MFVPAMPRRSSRKDSPAKLAGRMKRRWRVVLLLHKGEILGTVEAPDVAAAKAAAAIQFDLDDERQRAAIMVAAENAPGVKGVNDHLAWVEPMSGMAFSPSDEGMVQAKAS